MTGYFIQGRRGVVVAALMTMLVTPTTTTAAPAPQTEPKGALTLKVEGSPYDLLIALYRTGATDRAIDDLHELLTPKEGKERSDPQRQIDTWILEVGRRKRQADLEALFLLCTEALLRAWPSRSAFLEKRTPYWGPLDRLHDTLRRLNSKSPFLRAWYPLWESFSQLHIHHRWQDWPEYLHIALDAFPDDARILLAAGARQELEWWMSLENAQRGLGRVPPRVTGFLTAARGYLRRSVAADPGDPEAHLRLARVLLELNALDEAASALSIHSWKSDEAAFEYLARLFEGDLHERRGDTTAAVAAYDKAIALVEMPQSALVAKAHALYLDGQRSDAAAAASLALTEHGEQNDPWWGYLGGQSWRLTSYLNIARAMVIK